MTGADQRACVLYLPAGRPGAAPALASAGLRAAQVVRETEEGSRERLADALAAVAQGRAQTLAVARLRDVAGSLAELLSVVEWLRNAGAGLFALDVGLVTGAGGALDALPLLRELESWQRESAPGRRPRGRPGLRVRSPALGERIVAMRADGMSLQAIADVLNAEAIPTERGGERWRPSSVQAALGYRRPRPPAPGGRPPLPPHPPPHSKPHRTGPRRPHEEPR